MAKRIVIATVVILAVGALVAAFAYAGSSAKIASGVTVAGIPVGKLNPQEARALLERRAAGLDRVPLRLRVGERTFRLRAPQLGVTIDWSAAVDAAQDRGDGFGPVRGWRRLYTSVFGTEVVPPARIDRRLLDAQLARIAGAVDTPHREAAVRLRGLRPVVVPGRAGKVLNREAAAKAIVAEVVGLERRPLSLPLRTDPPKVTAPMLRRARRQAELALSAPVRLTLDAASYRVPPRTIARVLSLPEKGARKLRIAGPGADTFFARLAKRVNTPARDARFQVLEGGKVRVVPSVDARALDVPATAESLLRAALSPAGRAAPIVVGAKPAKRTTEDAKAMGITGLVGSYTTVYGGIANRIHNVRLVASLIDGALIAPGKEFSFNRTTGERNAAKGFLEAPVIINGELQTALGGGVCQVSTTVFNAAYESGLRITSRTNHALYISHYPQGRDATVDYPGIDLEFVNDTRRWLLLRTFVSASSLTVNLYGTPVDRRVETETSPLRVTGGPPKRIVKDPKLRKGKRIVEEAGTPARATAVRRRVYTAGGKLLYDNVWSSLYRGEIRVIRVGTKPKPKPKPAPLPFPAIPGGL